MAATDKGTKSVGEKLSAEDNHNTSSTSLGRGRGAKKGKSEAKIQNATSDAPVEDQPSKVKATKSAAKVVSEKSAKEKKAKGAPRATLNDILLLEAKSAFGSLNTSEGRTLRKRPERAASKSAPPKKVAKKIDSSKAASNTAAKKGRSKK